MTITCPNCQTQFHLDDQLYKPGRKARCSVCSFMFILPAVVPGEESPIIAPDVPPAGAPAGASLPNELDALDALGDLDERDAKGGYAVQDEAGFDEGDLPPPLPVKKGGGCLKRLALFLALLLCLGGLGVGAYLIYFQGQVNLPFKLPFDIPGTSSGVDPVAERIADIDKVRDLLLIDVSHEYVQNAKLGPLVVITGKVRNNFPTAKELIKVEATLLDKKGKVLATQQQFCGIVVPKLQLQVYGQKELAQALDNRYEVYANNINIVHGAEVPFMVVFVYPPSNMAEYTVVVADANDPPEIVPPMQGGQSPPGAP